MPQGISASAAGLDLSPRVVSTATVVASPAAASETIIASVTLDQDIATVEGVLLFGFAAFLIGASGTTVVTRIRQTDVSGTIIKATGATNVTAADVTSRTIVGFDTTKATVGQVYVLTLTVANGAAASTVSAVSLIAIQV